MFPLFDFPPFGFGEESLKAPWLQVFQMYLFPTMWITTHSLIRLYLRLFPIYFSFLTCEGVAKLPKFLRKLYLAHLFPRLSRFVKSWLHKYLGGLWWNNSLEGMLHAQYLQESREKSSNRRFIFPYYLRLLLNPNRLILIHAKYIHIKSVVWPPFWILSPNV